MARLVALGVAVALLLQLPGAGTAAASTTFPDVPAGHFGAPAIDWGVANDLTRGVGDTGLFMPDRDITRAELVTMLWRSAGSPLSSASLPLDVPSGHFGAPAVRWALERGITNGTTTFWPDRPITRAEIVTMLWRSEGEPAGTSALLYDVPLHHFAAMAVRWALDEGITSGVGSSGAFQPDRNLTRAEAITFVWRLRTGATAPSGTPPIGPHAFTTTGTSGNPGRWDPCSPIQWHVDYSGALHGNPTVVVPEAMRRLEQYTGLDFQQVGLAADADLRIRWGYANGAAGYASVSWYSYPTPKYFRAEVVVERNFQPGATDFGGSNSLGVLMLHELAHAVGLGHVEPTDHVMNPYIRPLTNYAAGDIYGLHRVGAAQGCTFTSSVASAGSPAAPPPVETVVVY